MTSTAVKQDFAVMAYEDWPLTFTVTTEAGTGKDLTDGSATLVIKSGDAETGTEILRMDGTIYSDQTGSPGRIDVMIPASDTQLWRGTLHYELRVADASGLTRAVTYGTITVLPTVIRS